MLKVTGQIHKVNIIFSLIFRKMTQMQKDDRFSGEQAGKGKGKGGKGDVGQI
jgi:hypothetical protein